MRRSLPVAVLVLGALALADFGAGVGYCDDAFLVFGLLSSWEHAMNSAMMPSNRAPSTTARRRQ